MIEIRDLIGKPYSTHGRGPDSFDCYGLVIEVCRRCGRYIPDTEFQYNGKSEDHAALLDETAPLVQAKKTDVPICGDVVVLLVGGRTSHVGVCIGDGNFIHCGKQGVRIESLASWSKRIEGIYTW